MSEKNYVGMLEEQCGVCGVYFESGIVLDRLLRNSLERVNRGGLAAEPCPDCQKPISDGYVCLIETTTIPHPENVDENCHSTMKLEEADRTGKSVWIKREKLAQMTGRDAELYTPIVYVEQGVIDHIVDDYKEELGALPPHMKEFFDAKDE